MRQLHRVVTSAAAPDLFAAVKAGFQRSRMEHHPGGNRGRAAPGSSFDYTWVEWERRVIGLKVRAISSFRLPMYWLFAIHLDLNSLVDRSSLKYDTGCVKVKFLTDHWP
jgi:hypothetical protein